ncbi:MAG TPA: tRNA guanosine(34) transglycosylase Tgt [Anaerolineae bacterium]|nr:tRNA guanosine(34) transglycosylase Tgt [Anaerolineae bacterium]MCB9106215.1 tRNA guanosine(34) transglycosylase Tgt [Anaerolineales bacterium]HRV92921.1 tRNA guanosine(34) transglycosylase Tgt [Anaerolineae bacterium]
MTFSFELLAQDTLTHARAGLIHTPHGDIPTPVFAPVGTQATVKTLTPADLHELGATLILANTYHLYLRPGPDLIADFGGLHHFMGWDGPILTDSGGFQVFSLEGLREIDEDGVTFRSHLDGSKHRFTPEQVIAIQEKLGADIIMAFDECPAPDDRDYNVEALDRTHRWAERCRQAQRRPDQALYGIVQGGIFPDLRIQSAEFLTSLDFPGYSIGGLSVGESKADMHAILEVLHPVLPAHKPRYLMGVGSPEDLFECVARGIDQFDCVLPTRIARNGAVFTPHGRVNLRNARFAADKAPIDPDCTCYTCRTFSRAYLRHLIIAKETLALRLTTIHNLHFMLDTMRRIRLSILDGSFAEYKRDFLQTYQTVPEENRGKRK